MIDFHTHAFPDQLARRAIETLEEKGGVPAVGDGTVAALLASMERAGIETSVVCPIATRPGLVAGVNDWAMSLLADERLVPFGSLHPGMAGSQAEAERLAEAGIKGIKLHPEYQDFFVDDPAVFPLYEAAGAAGLIVLFHAGADIGYEPPWHATPERLARVLDTFPGLDVVAAHLGGHLLRDEVARHLAGRDLWFDLAYFRADFDEAAYLSIIRQHGADRVLFATDYPWLDQAEAARDFARWPLTGNERRQIAAGNARALLGLGVAAPAGE